MLVSSGLLIVSCDILLHNTEAWDPHIFSYMIRRVTRRRASREQLRCRPLPAPSRISYLDRRLRGLCDFCGQLELLCESHTSLISVVSQSLFLGSCLRTRYFYIAFLSYLGREVATVSSKSLVALCKIVCCDRILI